MNSAKSDSKRKLLEAALTVIRSKGYGAARVDDICEEAELTKGSFFHHFRSKEDLAVAALKSCSASMDAQFASAPYHGYENPLDRVLGYIDFRSDMIQGDAPDYACLVGTMVQETHDNSPAIRNACERCIFDHAAELAWDLAAAKRLRVPDADWDPMDLAIHSQAVFQGAFIVANAQESRDVAVRSVRHLRKYIEFLFSTPADEV